MITSELFLPSADRDAGAHDAINPSTLSDTVIIVGNHMGSMVFREDMELGDAGRKAEALANRTNMPVLAFDRPGTGPDAEKLSVHPGNDIAIVSRAGDDLAKIIARHGFENVVLAGNSAAGSMAVSLACSETLPVTHLSVMDPVGVTDVSFGRGLTRWVHHSIRETKLEKPARTEDDPIEEATGFVFREFVRDSLAYHRQWQSSTTANELRTVARRHGDITTLVSWPEHTFTADPGRIQTLALELPVARQKAYPDPDSSKPFVTEITDGTSHAWYENFQVYADCIARVIDPKFANYYS